jgi:hypothetical protein
MAIYLRGSITPRSTSLSSDSADLLSLIDAFSLFAWFKQLVAMAQGSGIVDRLVIGGSFVTSKPEPNDIDLVIILSNDVDFEALTPSQYSVTDRRALRRVLKTEALDIITVRNGTTRMDLVLEFFQSKRDNKQVGVVEVNL